MKRDHSPKDFRICSSWPAFMKLRAISALCEQRSREAVPQLVELLRNDSNAIVRHESAFALGEMGFSEAVAPLQESLLGDPDTIVRHEAAFALGLMCLQEALDVLRLVPDDPDNVVKQTVEIAIDNLTYELNAKKNALISEPWIKEQT